MGLLSIAVAPVIMCMFYFYIRDKYEKEPINLVITGSIFGVITVFPIIHLGGFLSLFLSVEANRLYESFYNAFVISAFSEEIFKYIVLFFLAWRNFNFNEKFDGIVYAVFVSLGFAFLENILYVFDGDLGGYSTAFSRAIFSVPAHGLFGVHMGYYFGKAKFDDKKYLLVAFFVPYLLHAFYNFILLVSDGIFGTLIFTLFVILMWRSALEKMQIHLRASPFRESFKKSVDLNG